MAKKSKSNQPVSADRVAALTRISLGFVFLWAFLDKLIGLGFATCRGENGAVEVMCSSAWLEGGSPTTGFLKFGTAGSPFETLFSNLAGNAFVDWLFMIGLLGIGIALLLGIGVKIAAYSGALMMILMYLATFQPENNPLIDDHIVYALVLIWLWLVNDRQVWGFGDQWAEVDLVKQYPILK